MIQYTVSGGVCVLRLDSPPLNTITVALLEELRLAIGRANSDGGVRGIVVTGDSGQFSAGADINLLAEITSAEDAVRLSRVFHEVFQVVEDSTRPVVAAVAGTMMGGALELAMACHRRVCTKETTFNMPEVNLGINPAGGGTQRLPRLVGPDAALKMLLGAERIDAQRALDLGLVDAICESEGLVETARAVLQSPDALRKTSRRTDKIEDAAVNHAAFQRAQELLAGVRAEIIAPQKIAEAVRVGLEESFRAGLAKEREAFAQCMDTPAARNKIYLFFASRATGKVPDLADTRPGKIGKAAVVGMGSMGTGIAQALIAAEVPTVVLDEDGPALQKGLDKIRGSLQRRVARGRLSPQRAEQILGRIATATEWRQIADADLVIEAVLEDVPTKRSVLGHIEDVCAAGTIIASNTSTISLDALADRMRRPRRLIGMHFFNPAQRMPLVEIIRRKETPNTAIATAMKFAKTIGKTPVLVNNREGFLVNRIFIPYLKEAFWLLEDGADPPAVDRAMVEFGFSMGPLALIDMAGLDILVSTDRVMSRAFPRHGCVSRIAARLVEQGHLGQKTGSGVYKYEKGDYTPRHSETAQRIIAEVRREESRTPGEIQKDEITRRLVLRMVGEAFHVLEESVAERESDLDVAMVLGIGFPDFRGGVLKYARDLGLGSVLVQLDKLATRFGRRFSPCKLLREMKGAR